MNMIDFNFDGTRLALVLEGGYNLDTLCNRSFAIIININAAIIIIMITFINAITSVEQCTRALMGLTIEKIPHEELARR